MADVEKKARLSGEQTRAAEPATILPTHNTSAPEKQQPPAPSLHPAFYVATWIGFSGGVILFNKWLLDTLGFKFPITLTAWHMIFATFMTQVLARTTTLLDGRKNVKMTGRVYLRAILPIGFFFSLSLICGNKAYLYLSVAFIQMLKATMPVAVLLTSWTMGVAPPSLKTLGNVSFIVIGVVIASYGEIEFNLTGFLYQAGGITFEATRLVLVQRLLSSAEYKMDPLVSLYYFAPVCAVMNGLTALIVEVPNMTMNTIYYVGIFMLIANAMVAFMLNVSVVFLIGKTSSLVLTLCGILKDILLVAASMMIWGTPVSKTQFFGYSIALGGLLYYRLGSEQLKQYVSHVGRSWSEFGVQRPAMRKALVLGLVLITLFVLLGGLAPTYASSQTKNLKDMLSTGLGA
ncbi:sugar phosphate/phosphate translocator [Exophiala dermatitidis]